MEPSNKKVTKRDLVNEILLLVDDRWNSNRRPVSRCPVCTRWHATDDVIRRHMIYKHNKAELMNAYLRLLLEQD